MSISTEAEKPETRTSRQWLWFIKLWLGGLAAAFALGGVVKGLVYLASIQN